MAYVAVRKALRTRWILDLSITLPFVLPGILAGSSITFSTLLGELSMTISLYSAEWKTMTVAIYEYLLTDLLGPASALGTLLSVAVLLSTLLANKLLGRTLGSLFRMV